MENVPESDAVCHAIAFDVFLQAVPVCFVAVTVDASVQGNEFGIMAADGTGDLVAGAVFQVQVFEPVSIDPLAGSVDDFFKTGDAGEDGGHEEDGSDARFMDPPQGVQPSSGGRGAGFEMAAERVVQRIQRDGDFGVFKLSDEVDVPDDQVGLGDEGDACARALQLFEDPAGDAVLSFKGIVRVGDRADDDVFSVEPGRGKRFAALFDVQKISPVFRMAREGFHEFGIAIHTFVRTADIGIDDRIGSGQFRGSDPVFDRDGFRGDHVFPPCRPSGPTGRFIVLF